MPPCREQFHYIDILNIIDDDFPNEKVRYVPASNKIHRLREVLRGAFTALIGNETPNGGSYLSLDEVVSGNSLVRVYKQFNSARSDYSTRKTSEVYGEKVDFRRKEVKAYRQEVAGNILYKAVGIIDPKLERTGKKQNAEYLKMLEEGLVIPVLTRGIVTMDKPSFFPASYATAYDNKGSLVYLPVVEAFNVNREYIDFLKGVAGIVGKDPEKVSLKNMGKIMGAHSLVPEELRYL